MLLSQNTKLLEIFGTSKVKNTEDGDIKGIRRKPKRQFLTSFSPFSLFLGKASSSTDIVIQFLERLETLKDTMACCKVFALYLVLQNVTVGDFIKRLVKSQISI